MELVQSKLLQICFLVLMNILNGIRQEQSKREEIVFTHSCESQAERFIEVSGSWFIHQRFFSVSLSIWTQNPLSHWSSIILRKRKKKAFLGLAFVARNLQQLFPFVYDNLFFSASSSKCNHIVHNESWSLATGEWTWISFFGCLLWSKFGGSGDRVRRMLRKLLWTCS